MPIAIEVNGKIYQFEELPSETVEQHAQRCEDMRKLIEAQM